MEEGEEFVGRLLAHLDPEYLILLMKNEIFVGGGVGETVADEERLTDWDHSFDNIFMIKFRNPKRSRLIGTFLDMLYRLDHPLYLGIMEGVKNELATELEELAYRFRSGRLADLGFPSREEALEAYAPLDPDRYRCPEPKAPLRGIEGIVSFLPQEESFLQRALSRGGEETFVEFTYLVNSVLVAEGGDSADPANLRTVLERVHGFLTIGLESLSGNHDDKAAEMVRTVPLKDLFRVGLGVVRKLRSPGAGAPAGSERESVLRGVNSTIPTFWQGLDPQPRESYRPFRSMADVRSIRNFLEGTEH